MRAAGSGRRALTLMQTRRFGLNALSPIDGRYAHKVGDLRGAMSEYALMRERATVMIKWVQFLGSHTSVLPVPISTEDSATLDGIIAGARFCVQTPICLYIYPTACFAFACGTCAPISAFSPDDYETIKQREAVTKHDVKAVEYFLRDKVCRRARN